MIGKQIINKALRKSPSYIGSLLVSLLVLLGYVWGGDLLELLKCGITFLIGSKYNLSEWIGAFVSFGALIVAWYAFYESKKMRKSSTFSALFSQLIANHKDIFANNALSKTALVKDDKCDTKIAVIDRECDVFSNFYKYYEVRHEEVKKVVGEVNIVNVWDDYIKMIKEAAKFNNCFKYVYNEIRTVLDEKTIDDDAKKHYISIIQSYMNNEELFCYLINLLQHYGFYYRKDDYKSYLCKYGFFEDLLHSRDKHYSRLINDLRTTIAGQDLEDIIGPLHESEMK